MCPKATDRMMARDLETPPHRHERSWWWGIQDNNGCCLQKGFNVCCRRGWTHLASEGRTRRSAYGSSWAISMETPKISWVTQSAMAAGSRFLAAEGRQRRPGAPGHLRWHTGERVYAAEKASLPTQTCRAGVGWWHLSPEPTLAPRLTLFMLSWARVLKQRALEPFYRRRL